MDNIGEMVLRIVAFAVGLWLTLWTLLSAVRSFVLTNTQNTWLTRQVFIFGNRLMRLRLRGVDDLVKRERILSYFSPLVLLSLPVVWLTLITVGYAAMFWAISDSLDVRDAIILSGSSLMTLGFSFADEMPVIVLAFSEAILSMMFIALLIGYLPTMYSAFSEREALVTKLEFRAGSPPDVITMFERLDYSGILHDEGRMWDLWETWEDWFAHLEESHTVLGPLNFFRSPQPRRHWLSAAGTVLDAASLVASTVDIPNGPRAGLTVRAGFVALRAIADFFRIPYDEDPEPVDPISITREEFDRAYDQLAAMNIPLLADRDQCWIDFKGWRVNYDDLLCRISTILQVPPAPWTTDRNKPTFGPLHDTVHQPKNVNTIYE